MISMGLDVCSYVLNAFEMDRVVCTYHVAKVNREDVQTHQTCEVKRAHRPSRVVAFVSVSLT